MSLRSVLYVSQVWGPGNSLIITPRCLILVLDVNEMPWSVGKWLDNVILNCLGHVPLRG